MNLLFETLAGLTIGGSVIVLSIFLINFTFSKNFSAKWQYALRKLAILFFLVPIWLLIPRLNFSQTKIDFVGKLPFTSHLQVYRTDLGIPFQFAFFLFIVWSIGVVVSASWHVYCYKMFKNTLSQSNRNVPKNHELYQLVNQQKKKLNIKRNIKLAYNDQITSPALVGLLQPKILLPSITIPPVELEMIIHHELIHYKEKDLWVKFFALIVSIFHWFNPLVYMLKKEIHVWSELSCDAQVVIDLSHAKRKQYGQIILHTAESKSRETISFGMFFAHDKNNLKRRLVAMLNVKKVKKSTFVIATTALIIVGIIGTTASAFASNKIPSVNSSNMNPETLTLEEKEVIELHEKYIGSVKRSATEEEFALINTTIETKLSAGKDFTMADVMKELNLEDVGFLEPDNPDFSESPNTNVYELKDSTF